MTLSRLLDVAGVAPDAFVGDAEIFSVTPDSRNVGPGSLFVCMPSANQDSHRFIAEAVSQGAVAVLSHSEHGFAEAESKATAACLIANDGDRFSDALWRIAKAFYGNPTHDLKVIGITGTNGKTTTAWILRQMLGMDSAYLGTLGFSMAGKEIPLANTTPFSLDLNKLIWDARRFGLRSLVMEVSSHALQEHRADGLEFDSAIFTNLTQDHLDFHRTMEAYARAKLKLFTELPRLSSKPFTAILNTDDAVGAQWAKTLTCPVFTYGFQSGDLQAEAGVVSVDRLTMKLRYKGREHIARAQLGGSFNLWNCLSAVAGLLGTGYEIEDALARLAIAQPAPGRFEAVANDAGIGILVDYAHTPDAVSKLLEAVRSLNPKRILTVFGCGGDRDRTKRPLMARAASSASEVTFATSDNPRTEDPRAILADVTPGLVPESETHVIIDRREAIAAAISMAQPGDVVVIAGKGHENYQIIGREKTHFDDREVAAEAASLRGAGS